MAHGSAPGGVQASLASGSVDICLIPEVKFDLHGEHGVLAYAAKLLRKNGHCVICVAEGAGQVRSPCSLPPSLQCPGECLCFP